MKRILWLAVGLLIYASGSPLLAQDYTRPATGPYAPPVSPYFNLLRGGNPAVNYYGLVRPQMDSQRAIQQLQQNPAAPVTTGLTMDPYPNTGHTVQFMNLSHYFNNNIGTGLTGGRVGTPPFLRR